MPSLDFDVVYNYDRGADDHAATVQVRLFPPSGVPLVVNAVLDTGAAISMFDRSLAAHLGIVDARTGKQFPVLTASGEEGEAYAHDLEIEFLGQRITVPIGFCPDWPDGTTNLLGMQGFFEQLQVAFKHRERLFFSAAS